ncbi:MAG: Eco57I restriction-modification methylase domain-containing protein [Bacteroidales bacterium]
MSNKFTSTFAYRLIYIFRINDKAHDGVLKVGSATVHTDLPINTLAPNCRELNQAAKKRINDYTSTAGVVYELLHAELAIYNNEGSIKAFLDKKVHDVLLRSGIKKERFDTDRKQNEWFRTDLDSAKNAIKAVKEGRAYLGQSEITQDKSPIIFRPEQKAAIEKTVAQFKKSNRVLWNAKMRFGKTLSALEVAKRMEAKRTLIFTHRPVVSDGWLDDFLKIFYNTDNYLFGSKRKDKGVSLEDLEKSGKNYVYFASIQDLRGSDLVGGKFDKNEEVFETAWDYLIIDEAHEGTRTELGDSIKDWLTLNKPKVLELSGTPFNLMEDYDEKEIYTWDYVMEQRAKREWDEIHLGDPNPYEELPELNIFTYSLGKLFANSDYIDLEDKAFNFKEFFRTWTGDVRNDRKHLTEGAEVGDFVHKDDILSFLNLITKSDKDSNYPFSTEEYRDFFRHSLWMVPGVKEAKALSTLMKLHPVFGSGLFEIVNVAGDGDEEQQNKDSLDAVRKAIGKEPDKNYTITLSCGRLTTGVSVPEWTAVFMLSGSYSTSAANYLQTIFRVQTPANIGGKLKEKCYVFDFAPDRTLKMVAEASKISSKAGHTSADDRLAVGDFLNFCPVIAIDGTKMQQYDVGGMLEQLKKAYTDRVVKNGFDDKHIYNDELLKLDGLALDEFKALKEIVGASKQTKKSGDVDVNKQGLTNEEYDQLERINKKPKKELTEADKKFQEEVKEKRKNRDTAISILRGISIRIPLLVYGADVAFKEEITTENFTKLIDPLSWEEFMPRGITKDLFKKFTRYYDADVFVAAARQIRNLAKSADNLSPTERVKKISALFATFKNPDKETVLTPWRVVNKHLGDCLGGYDFFDEQHTETVEYPRFIDHGEVTAKTVANPEARILEINSKTGLYPLYVTYSIFRKKCDAYCVEELTSELEVEIWNKTVAENIYVICKTKMARSITKRTLVGYTDSPINAHAFDDLLNQISDGKADNFIEKIKKGSTFRGNNTEKDMKFNAVVGNPPYQVMDGGSKASATPVYDKFVEIAKRIKTEYVSMIIPAKWYNGGRGLDDFRSKMLNDTKMKKLVDFADSNDCFNGVDIAGGVCYFLWDDIHSGLCSVVNVHNGKTTKKERKLSEYKTFVRSSEAISILEKILNSEKAVFFDTLVSSQKPFGLRTYVKPSETGDLTLRYSGGKGAYNRADVTAGIEWIDKWKVITSYLTYDHAGRADKEGKKRIISTLEVLQPKEICTETYIVVDTFATENEAINLLGYIKTKFTRFLIAQLTSTQHLSKANFAFLPVQDFSKPWTDAELYAKYGLTEDETAFIESMIKPME